MVRNVARGVFISYAREDSEIVTLAAKLLRAGGAKVFQDVVDIEYGARWHDVLIKAISQCERVLVFWSAAAAASEWVEREWRAAFKAGKRIVPMLLDETPLPWPLTTFNGMPDLMSYLRPVKHVPMQSDAAHQAPGPADRYHPEPGAPVNSRKPIVAVAVLVMVLVIVGLAFTAWTVWKLTLGDGNLGAVLHYLWLALLYGGGGLGVIFLGALGTFAWHEYKASRDKLITQGKAFVSLLFA